mgnify:CR=1 FL=1
MDRSGDAQPHPVEPVGTARHGPLARHGRHTRGGRGGPAEAGGRRGGVPAAEGRRDAPRLRHQRHRGVPVREVGCRPEGRQGAQGLSREREHRLRGDDRGQPGGLGRDEDLPGRGVPGQGAPDDRGARSRGVPRRLAKGAQETLGPGREDEGRRRRRGPRPEEPAPRLRVPPRHEGMAGGRGAREAAPEVGRALGRGGRHRRRAPAREDRGYDSPFRIHFSTAGAR